MSEEKKDRVMVTYPEDQSTKDWLEKNTGKTGMSKFIRESVAEKIRRKNKLCMDCGNVKVSANNALCAKCYKSNEA